MTLAEVNRPFAVQPTRFRDAAAGLSGERPWLGHACCLPAWSGTTAVTAHATVQPPHRSGLLGQRWRLAHLQVEALQPADLPRQGLEGGKLVAGQRQAGQLAAGLQVARRGQVVVGQVQLPQLGRQGRGGVHALEAVVGAGQVLQPRPAGVRVCAACRQRTAQPKGHLG